MAAYTIRRSAALVLASLLAYSVAGCDGDDGHKTDGAVKAQNEKGKREKKDRGNTSMELGGAAWVATAANARTSGKKMTIRASRTDVTDGDVKRQELHLQLDDFHGAGDYLTGISGSRFIGVGFDTGKAKEAARADEATGKQDETAKLAVAAITSAKHLILMNAKVHVDDASDAEVSGTFSWTPPAGLKDAPTITNGKFRALVKQGKK